LALQQCASNSQRPFNPIVCSNDQLSPFISTLDLDAYASLFEENANGGILDEWRIKYQKQLQLVQELLCLENECNNQNQPFNQTKFLAARNFVATHSFSDPNGGHYLFPWAINLNHQPEMRANARWRIADKDNWLLVWAVRDIQVGEEVSISYGIRSNAQLSATYGFTVEPEFEPLFSCELSELPELESFQAKTKYKLRLATVPFTTCSQTRCQDGMEELTTSSKVKFAFESLVSLRHYLRHASTDERQGVEQTLFDLIQTMLERHVQNEVTSKFVSNLQENRVNRPDTCIWWRSIQSGQDPVDNQRDMSSPSAVGSRRQSDRVRAAMSEYMCLLVYYEALALRRGCMNSTQVLHPSVSMVPLLDALLTDAQQETNDMLPDPTQSRL